MQENSQRQIKLSWKGRDGNTSPDFSTVMTRNITHTTDPLVPDTGSLTSLWYDIPSVLLKADSSISNFWFEVDEGDGSSKVENQGGAGYPIQDVVMVANTTCVGVSNSLSLSLKFAVSPYRTHTSRIVVHFSALLRQVRGDIQPSRIYLKVDDFDSTGAPFVTTTDITVSSTSAVAGYNVQTTLISFPLRAWTLAVDADGKTYETTYIADGSSEGLSNSHVPTCQ